MLLSKQTQNNCSLRRTVSLLDRSVLWAGGQRTSRGRNPTNQGPGPAAGGEHPDIFLALTMGQHWSCDSLNFGLTDHLFSDLKNSYTGLMNTEFTVQLSSSEAAVWKSPPWIPSFFAPLHHTVPAATLAKAEPVKGASQGVLQQRWSARHASSPGCQQIKWLLSPFLVATPQYPPSLFGK